MQPVIIQAVTHGTGQQFQALVVHGEQGLGEG
jgi:hypothetical protein